MLRLGHFEHEQFSFMVYPPGSVPAAVTGEIPPSVYKKITILGTQMHTGMLINTLQHHTVSINTSWG